MLHSFFCLISSYQNKNWGRDFGAPQVRMEPEKMYVPPLHRGARADSGPRSKRLSSDLIDLLRSRGVCLSGARNGVASMF